MTSLGKTYQIHLIVVCANYIIIIISDLIANIILKRRMKEKKMDIGVIQRIITFGISLRTWQEKEI